jgi:uncharacterized protein YciW
VRDRLAVAYFVAGLHGADQVAAHAGWSRAAIVTLSQAVAFLIDTDCT